MAISAPQLVSHVGPPVDCFFTQIDGESRLFILTAKKGATFPRREISTTTVEAVIAASGPKLQNHETDDVQRFDQGFHRVSAFQPDAGDKIVRLYWSLISQTGARTIFEMTYDLAEQVAGAVTALAFEGDDPYILDARTVDFPTRLYMVYINAAGNNAYRISLDLGTSWGTEVLIDDFSAVDHLDVEASLNDPLGLKEDVQVLQRRTS